MNHDDGLDALPDNVRKLLQEAEDAAPAPSEVKARLFSRLSGELFVPAPPAGGSPGSPHAQPGPGTPPSPAAPPIASTAAPWTTAAVTKLALGVGVATFAVGGFVGAGVHASLAPPPPPAPMIVPAPPPLVEPLPVALAPVPPPPPEVMPPPVAARLPRREVVASAPPPLRVEASPVDVLGQERSLIEQARSALTRARPDDALTVLAQHQVRFPDGQLAEERLAMQVVALHALGRDEQARDLATLFRQQYPQGLFLPVVESATPKSP